MRNFLSIAALTISIASAVAREQPGTNAPPIGLSGAAGITNASPGTAAPESPDLTYEYETDKNPRWVQPSEKRPTFGERTTNSIKVAIYGSKDAVKNAGFYFLPKDSRVLHAVEAAVKVAFDPRYSGLQRLKPDGTWMIVRFRNNMRKIDGHRIWELIPLEEGDQIFGAHEVF